MSGGASGTGRSRSPSSRCGPAGQPTGRWTSRSGTTSRTVTSRTRSRSTTRSIPPDGRRSWAWDSGDRREREVVAAEQRIAGWPPGVDHGPEDVPGDRLLRTGRADDRHADQPPRDAAIAEIELHDAAHV